MQSTIFNHGWGHNSSKRKIHWIVKEKLCQSKFHGSLGFRELEVLNLVILAKQVWRLMHLEHSLVFKVLKTKYSPSCGILDADVGTIPGSAWRSLCQPRWVVEKGSRWLVGDEWSLNIWNSKRIL